MHARSGTELRFGHVRGTADTFDRTILGGRSGRVGFAVQDAHVRPRATYLGQGRHAPSVAGAFLSGEFFGWCVFSFVSCLQAERIMGCCWALGFRVGILKVECPR